MKSESLNDQYQQAIQKISNNDFEGALCLVKRMQALGSNYLTSLIAGQIMIEAGIGLRDECAIKEGVQLLKTHLIKIIQHNEYTPTAYYTLANGYYELFRIKRIEDPYYIYLKESELNHAKELYVKAFDHGTQNNDQISKTYVNLGNCYDHLGRVVDALECYEEALRLNPDNGMALGNKGMAMCHYGWLAGQHQATFLIEAYSLLSKALKSDIPPDTRNDFARYQDRIRSRFSNKEALDNPAKYPGYRISADSDFERFLIEFCMKNKLYVNICDFCQKCDASIGDMIDIQKMVVSINDDNISEIEKNPYYRLCSYLNQIKQDYVGARFLLIASQYKKLDLKFIDKRVKIVNTLDYNIHNVYVQLLKFSFKCFYDVLDKIACFINEYLSLGIPERKIDFHCLWYTDKNKTVSPAIKK